jgi:CRP-like cAMP-binding protein
MSTETLTLDQRIAALECFPALKGVPAPALRALAEQMREEHLEPGERIAYPGKPLDGVRFVLSGWFEVRIAGVLITRYPPGELCGDVGAFTTANMPGICIAAAPLVSLWVGFDAFRSAVEHTPKLAQNILRLHGARLRVLNVLRFLHYMQGAPAPVLLTEGDRVAVLRGLPLFSGIDDPAFLGRLAANVQEVRFSPGAEICRRGTPNDTMILVVAGEAEARLDDDVIGVVTAGYSFGELGLLDGEPHPVSLVAVTPVHALTLGRAQLFAATNQSPKMILNLIGVLAWRVLATVMDVAPRMAKDEDPLPPSGGDAQKPKQLPYLDLPEEAWVKSPYRRWRMPLTGDLTRQFADIAAVASIADPTQHAPDTDDFKRALDEERRAFEGALQKQGCAGNLLQFASALYSRLRSTIQPKKGHLLVAGAIAAAVAQGRPVRLRAVLASPTAVAEVPSFLRVASLFREYGFRVDLRALLVRWENLVDVEQITAETRGMMFNDVVASVRHAFGAADFDPSGVEPVNIEVSFADGILTAPPEPAKIFESIVQAGADLSRAEATLGRDLVWITGFYERQASLNRLGPRQPLIDLALRRYIGAYFSTEANSEAALFMLTSELHKRFLGCYGASVPMLNIQLA